MNTSFEALDYVIFAIYAIVILGVGLWVSRNKKGETKSTEDYFWRVNLFLGGQLELH